ncbi:zinc ribbon domain-containing protein [Spirochaetota bacterium]
MRQGDGCGTDGLSRLPGLGHYNGGRLPGRPAGSKFCPKCGANVEGSNCKKCNAKLAPGAKFCPECGEKQE